MTKTIEEIRDAFHHVHDYAMRRTDRPYMRIPADPERDADLIVTAAITELEALRARLAAAEALMREARPRLDRCDSHDLTCRAVIHGALDCDCPLTPLLARLDSWLGEERT